MNHELASAIDGRLVVVLQVCDACGKCMKGPHARFSWKMQWDCVLAKNFIKITVSEFLGRVYNLLCRFKLHK